MKTPTPNYWLAFIASGLLFFLSLVSGFNVAQASDMQLTFRGIVDEIYGSGVPGLYIGDEVSGKLIYDSSATDENPYVGIGWFPNAITSYEVSIGEKVYALIPPSHEEISEIAIENDIPIYNEYRDHIRYLGFVFEDQHVEYRVLQLDFGTTTSTPSSWIETDATIPNDIDLTVAQSARGNIRTSWPIIDATYFTLTNAALAPVPIPIVIDIVPIPAHKLENIVDLDKGKNIKVAVVGTSEFDPLCIDPNSVTFGPDQIFALRHIVRDYNHDRHNDLIFTFNIDASGIDCDDIGAVLNGETYDGEIVEGSDVFTVVPCY